ncbi:MAG: hypothetical protein K0V04_34950 [Deltaproteobacteria bacterium]|nr:hypothetical protein [Deltaproteobacteria bacterium]
MRPIGLVMWGVLLVAGCAGDDGATTPTGSTGATTATNAGTTAGESTTAVGSTTADGTADETATEGTGPAPLPARLGVSADWAARTLSVIDLDALAAGAVTREEVVARTIDLSAYAPGPLQVELAPDGLTAVVAVSPGFFGGFVGGLIGAVAVEQDGTLLVVNLETEDITEIATMHVPMGIAITPDGTQAFTANYGLDDPVGSTLSVIDLVGMTVVEEVEVGDRPEQVSLNEDGTLGMLNVVALGGVRVFQTSDPSGTLSDVLEVGADPSDVAFLPGTSYAVVSNSLDPSNYVVVDVTDPGAPAEVAVGPSPVGIHYAATSIPGTTDVVLGVSDFASLSLHRVSVAADGTPTLTWETTTPGATFPLGIAIDVQANLALAPAPGLNGLVVQGLDGGPPTVVPWQDEVGPTYVAVAP